MSRTKKSRKPASAPTAKPKLSKQELANVEKRVRKKTGKQSGNRQQEAYAKKTNTQGSQAKKDPRIGSKTPIALGKLTEKAQKKVVQKQPKDMSPIAAIRPVSSHIDETSPQQALAQIEQDEQLQVILAKQEDDVALTEQEVDYYNSMMERHQALSEALGLDDEEQVESAEQSLSEDDLWDKLDSDFSEFDKES